MGRGNNNNNTRICNRVCPCRILGEFSLTQQPRIKYLKPSHSNFNAYQEARGLSLVWDETLPFYDPNPRDGRTVWHFQCDFLRPTKGGSYDIDFEIDELKDKASAWKDGLKNLAGLKVVHISYLLCNPRYWVYLDELMGEAIMSSDKVVHIPG